MLVMFGAITLANIDDAKAYTVNIATGTKSAYLRVGDGSIA